MRNIIIGVVIGALLASIVAAALWPRKPAVPPAVAVKPDTTGMVVKDGETTYVIEYRPDPAASKELSKLRDELVKRAKAIERITGYLADLELENRYLADSLSRIVLDSVRGLVRVERGPTGIAVVSYQNGLVQTWRLPVWRQRWTLLAGTDKPSVKTSRLPFDAGLFAAGGFTTPPSDWQPAPYVWAGLAITRQCVSIAIGPAWDGTLRLRGEVRLEWK